jgi:hypothetical protein
LISTRILVDIATNTHGSSSLPYSLVYFPPGPRSSPLISPVLLYSPCPPLIDAQQWDKARCRPQTEWLAKTWDTPRLMMAGYSRGAGGEDGLPRFRLARSRFSVASCRIKSLEKTIQSWGFNALLTRSSGRAEVSRCWIRPNHLDRNWTSIFSKPAGFMACI